MTVIRVTTAKAGAIITSVLKQFLEEAQGPKGARETQPGSKHRGAIWKGPAPSAPSLQWQQFDVIGDFGESDKQKLVAKLSAWSLNRSAQLTV